MKICDNHKNLKSRYKGVDEVCHWDDLTASELLSLLDLVFNDKY